MYAFAEAGKTNPNKPKTNPTCRGGLSIVALAKMEASGEAGSNPMRFSAAENQPIGYNQRSKQ